jgi:uncharacterized protein YkwD
LSPVSRRRARFIGGAVALAAVGAILLFQIPDQNVQSQTHKHRNEHMLRLTNAARLAADAHRLRMSGAANKLAKDHSRKMAAADQLFHTQKYRYSNWAENIGAGTNVYGLFKAFMHSHEHRVNMLNRRYSRVGIGFVKRSGVLWITMVFFG